MNLLQIDKKVFSTKTNKNRCIEDETNLPIWANLPSRRNGRFPDQSNAKHVKYDEFFCSKIFHCNCVSAGFPYFNQLSLCWLRSNHFCEDVKDHKYLAGQIVQLQMTPKPRLHGSFSWNPHQRWQFSRDCDGCEGGGDGGYGGYGYGGGGGDMIMRNSQCHPLS